MILGLRKGRMVLVQWEDIVECHKRVKPRDYDTVLPTFETVGQIGNAARSIVIVEPEWLQRGDPNTGRKYDGETASTMMFIPLGCVKNVYELRRGPLLYSRDGG